MIAGPVIAGAGAGGEWVAEGIARIARERGRRKDWFAQMLAVRIVREIQEVRFAATEDRADPINDAVHRVLAALTRTRTGDTTAQPLLPRGLA